jgi:hypothetical protein
VVLCINSATLDGILLIGVEEVNKLTHPLPQVDNNKSIPIIKNYTSATFSCLKKIFYKMMNFLLYNMIPLTFKDSHSKKTSKHYPPLLSSEPTPNTLMLRHRHNLITHYKKGIYNIRTARRPPLRRLRLAVPSLHNLHHYFRSYIHPSLTVFQQGRITS